MANTTNYNWETPDDTDLVKDGAAAIRTLGNSIDTTTKNLNPETTTGDIAYRSATANTNTRLAIGTTGQVLTVAAGVPSWATPTTGDIEGVTAGTGISGGGTSGTVTITNSMATAIDAKGDLIVGTGADTFSRLAVGTNGQVLTADSSEATGLKFAAPAAGGMTSIASGSLSTGTTTIDSISGSYNNLVLFLRDYSTDSDAGDIQIRFNNDTTANYHIMTYQQCEVGASYADGQNTSTFYFTASGAPKAADNNNSLALTIYDYAFAGITRNAEFLNSVVAGGGGNAYSFKANCAYRGTSAITRIDILTDAGSFDGGTYVLYGVK